ncbi:MAG TPA: glutamine-hydrolyzing carbamoyl-phosphate synthase small subunit [Chthoniobacteraceae bacterium]|nr:glutamine-hydrolyzing carbamoyl-phosphate synthase small subunit [Chthoniobacteraceae bacterium]
MRAILALEDGRLFEGDSFGAKGTSVGEIVFNTAMSGYQEAITDPGSRGLIIAMTATAIGNTGINSLDNESSQAHPRGLVVEEINLIPSNWRSEMSLNDFLTRSKIPGISGIDTRALTVHIRTHGTMKACLSTDPAMTPEKAVELAASGVGFDGVDFVQEVTTPETYEWDPDDQLSRRWNIAVGAGEVFEPLPPVRFKAVVIDLGVKFEILRKLRQNGFKVTVVPATTPAGEILALEPDAIVLSNGPGDPDLLEPIHATVRELLGKKPIFGIALGHLVLARALGAKLLKLRAGHHGGNVPVKDLATGKVLITAQGHGAAVDPASLPEGVEVTHVNLNDESVEGIRHAGHSAVGIQFHPEASGGPHENAFLFADFAKLVEKNKGA